VLVPLHNFFGFSGSTIVLYQSNLGKVVRKTGLIERNYEKLIELKSKGFNVPKILYKEDTVLDMEYVEGNDMETFILHNDITYLTEHLCDLFTAFSMDSCDKNYTDTYIQNLVFVDDDEHLPFKSHELLAHLPKVLPTSTCHGDLTFENILYSTDNCFVMIDVSSGDYDSWVFDLAKLRQDLDAKWFLRNSNVDLTAQLASIKNTLYKRFPLAFDDSIYILMLLRVYRHCVFGTKEHELILNEICRLWK
jgi:tRNA A-37 threonylcarbamoyl transferase component Bud32